MGVSSTRVGDHRGSARTVQFLKNVTERAEPEVRTSGRRARGTWRKFGQVSPVRSTDVAQVALRSLSAGLCVHLLSVSWKKRGRPRPTCLRVSLSRCGLAVVCLSLVGSIPAQPQLL